jgi:hypothetical protein
MDQLITQQIENMCRMLTKTREDVKVLRAAVTNLHMALASGDDAPPVGMEKLIPVSDEEQRNLINAHIEVCSRELCDILQISQATLKRWRSNRMLDFKYKSATHVSYDLSLVYEGIKSGKLTCKGLDKMTALERILTYYRNISQLWTT